MRVITGTARGKKLRTLEGLEVRPTSDKVKEAIFSIIQFDIPEARVLDLFAGSGQLGIEALSRGAKECVFVDKSKASIGCIRENVESCGFSDRSRIYNADALDYLLRAGEFDIILIDPPYRNGLVESALERLEGRLSAGGTVVCEHEARLELPEEISGLIRKKEYAYGKTVALTTYKLKDTEE